MKTLHSGIAMVLGGFLVVTLAAQDVAPRRENPTVVVGTFDSRGVLMAYVRSDDFKEYLAAQQADVGRAIERARAAGDEDLVVGLGALGPAMQKRIHQQGFGTGPVDDIIARIEDQLPAIAEAAGVDVIVSKWELDYRAPDAKFVDVTHLLAAAFDPDESTLKSIQQLIETDPVPQDQIKEDH